MPDGPGGPDPEEEESSVEMSSSCRLARAWAVALCVAAGGVDAREVSAMLLCVAAAGVDAEDSTATDVVIGSDAGVVSAMSLCGAVAGVDAKEVSTATDVVVGSDAGVISVMSLCVAAAGVDAGAVPAVTGVVISADDVGESATVAIEESAVSRILAVVAGSAEMVGTTTSSSSCLLANGLFKLRLVYCLLTSPLCWWS